jgi:hypothetical protein
MWPLGRGPAPALYPKFPKSSFLAHPRPLNGLKYFRFYWAIIGPFIKTIAIRDCGAVEFDSPAIAGDTDL